MNEFDVITVGAGVGGLAAAAVLARGGLKVLIIEKSHAPGGFASSFKRGRFEFDVSLHELCGFGRYDKPFGGVRKLFDELDISDKIDWVDVKDAYRLITCDCPEPIDITMPFGIENYIDKAEIASPGSRPSLEKLFALCEENRIAMGELSGIKNSEEKLDALMRHRDFLKNSSMSVNEVLSELKVPPKAADIFRGYWAYILADCDNLSFFHYISMLNSYIELGSVVPKARGYEISSALAKIITDCGGKLLLNTEVTEILTDDGRVSGVKTASGASFYAKDVICDISPHIVFGSLLPEGKRPKEDIKRANARDFSGRGFCVYLGLDKSAAELGLNDYSYFIFPDMDTAKQFKLMASPETNRVQNTVCLSAINPDASPPGTAVLCMTTLFTDDWWGKVSDKDYFREKEDFADIMIETFERATGIGIRAHIEEIEIASPETFARFTGTPQGAIYGYLGKKDDGVLARQFMGDNHSQGINGLHLVGGYGSMLHGYSSAMASGADAAHYILRQRQI